MDIGGSFSMIYSMVTNAAKNLQLRASVFAITCYILEGQKYGA